MTELRATVGHGYWRVLAATDVQITRLHRGSLHARESARNSFETAVAWFCRVENGQIVETWSLPDGQWLVAQLGATPGGT